MHLELNTKVIILLFLLSITTLIGYRIGLFDTSYKILDETKNMPKLLIESKGLNASFKQSNGVAVRCKLETLEQYNFCGVAIALNGKETEYGIDLRGLDTIEVSISYSAPLNSDKVKITFRNYNPLYSNSTDRGSLKFNSIAYNPNRHQSTIEIPFASLKVEKWWIEQYQTNFKDSQVDLSNVISMEIITDNMNDVGDYAIDIKSITLHGKLISESNLLKLMLIIWLVIIICLITLQRNKLKSLSITDSLTGLYNRQGIESWANKKIATRINHHMCLIYINLDDFKKINDIYGHKAGDHFLVCFSKLIQQYLKLDKNIIYKCSRLSGDEFALVIIHKNNQVKQYAEDLLQRLEAPILFKNHATYIHATLGISEHSDQAKNFEALLTRAESAVHYAKKEGENSYQLFNDKVSQDIFFRKKIAEKIKNAIIHDHFHLNFMPIVDAKSLKMKSVEVLLRTNSDQFQGIGPDVFIPIAEEYNLIKNIDLWVIETTFKLMQKEQTFIQDSPFIFSINISAMELHNPLFVPQFKGLLKQYKIDPSMIDLEITETSLIDTDKKSISTLEDIHALGINLTLDDFGTGYTAFSQLISYPVNCLKIDKSFIDNLISTDKTQATMVKAIIAIAKSYQLKTIAEGIEDKAQYKFLVDHGCDMIQGYLFAKPMHWHDLKKSMEPQNTIDLS